VWVREYNEDRHQQGVGGSVPSERFRLSQADQPLLQIVEAAERSEVLDREPARVPVTRLVSAKGSIGFGAQRYLAIRWLSGETVEALSDDGLVEIVFCGQVIATHARKHDPDKAPPSPAQIQAAEREQPQSLTLSLGHHRNAQPDSSTRCRCARGPAGARRGPR